MFVLWSRRSELCEECVKDVTKSTGVDRRRFVKAAVRLGASGE